MYRWVYSCMYLHCAPQLTVLFFWYILHNHYSMILYHVWMEFSDTSLVGIKQTGNHTQILVFNLISDVMYRIKTFGFWISFLRFVLQFLINYATLISIPVNLFHIITSCFTEIHLIHPSLSWSCICFQGFPPSKFMYAFLVSPIQPIFLATDSTSDRSEFESR
jgi:hypothetical protein